MAKTSKLEDRLSARSANKLREPIKPVDIYSTAVAPSVEKTVDSADKKVPFSTSLSVEQKKKIKLYALSLGIKDREVVQRALDEFFVNHDLITSP